jgi:hypothetical protein
VYGNCLFVIFLFLLISTALFVSHSFLPTHGCSEERTSLLSCVVTRTDTTFRRVYSDFELTSGHHNNVKKNASFNLQNGGDGKGKVSLGV